MYTHNTIIGACFASFGPIEEESDEDNSEVAHVNVGDEHIEDTLDGDPTLDYVPIIVRSTNTDPYPNIEKKREILNFWKSGRKLKTLDQMQHKYRKLTNIRTLYNWEKEIEEGNTHCLTSLGVIQIANRA